MRKPGLLSIFLTVVIDLLGFGIVLPLLPLYADHYGASELMIGLLFTSFSAMQFAAAPLWGRWSDRVGRRPAILVGLTGSLLSYLLFAWAAHNESLAGLFASRITAGIFGGTIATAYAYIADVTPPKERGRGMALIGMAFGIGFTLGPAVGGLGHALHPAVPGLFAATFSLVALLYAARRLVEPERHVPAERTRWLDLAVFRRAMRAKGVARILTLTFLTVTCFALMESTLALLAKRSYEFNQTQVGLLFSYLGFWSALTQGWIVRRWLKRIGEPRMATIGTMVLAIGLFGLSLAPSVLWLGVLAPLAVLGFGMTLPSLNGLLSVRSGADVQGGVLGVSQSIQSLARIVGPLVGLPLFGLAAARPFQIGAGAMLLGTLLALGLGMLGGAAEGSRPAATGADADRA